MPDKSVRRQLEQSCGKSKPAVSMFLCAPVNWRGRMRRNKHLQMQLSGKASHTRMALHSRKSRSFQPVKLTEWIGEKEVFFISCQERSLSRPKGSYLCVYGDKNPGQESKSETTGNSPPDDKPPQQDDKSKNVPAELPDEQKNGTKQESKSADKSQDDQTLKQDKPNEEPAKASDKQESEQKVELTGAEQTNSFEPNDKSLDDQPPKQNAKPNEEPADASDKQENEQEFEKTEPDDDKKDNTIQGQESTGDNETENLEKKEVENAREFNLRKTAVMRSEDESESNIIYQTGCLPDVKSHNDQDVFMLFRLLKPDLGNQGMYSRDML